LFDTRRLNVPLFGGKQITRVFFTTDVHGSTVVFKKFINAAKFYDAQVIILGGDMVGKMIVPLVEQAGHRYHANYLGKIYDLAAGEELEKLEQTLENSGLYPIRVSPEEVESFHNHKEMVEARFGVLAADRVSKWLEIAEERLKGTGIRCYIQPGNDDPYAIDAAFRQSDVITNVDRTIVDIDEYHQMISVGAANETPWHCPRDKTEEELAGYIDALASKVKNMEQAIFNLHVPPHGTNLDQAPELDENLTPRLSLGGGFKIISVGSLSVRAAIERYQPLLGLHGHIHESRSAQKIGRTMCINPGSEYGEGVLRGVVLELSPSKLEDYVFTQG
jgi:Icc-related predicted phosphoesterase